MKGDHESLTSHGSSGIAFTDEESIITHLDNFCNHVRSMIDIIHTLSQFCKLRNDIRNLPRVEMDAVIHVVAPVEDQSRLNTHLKVLISDGGKPSTERSGSEHSHLAEGILLSITLTISSGKFNTNNCSVINFRIQRFSGAGLFFCKKS